MQIKLNQKRLFSTESVKYLSTKIDENFNWCHHINDIVIKLNRANDLLYKIKSNVNSRTQKLIYFALFKTHLNHASLVWTQNTNALL